MSECPDCGIDHAKAKPLDGEALVALTEYDTELDALLKRLMNDERLGKNAEERADLQVSTLNILAAQVAGRSAVKLMERVEELTPEITSREQLANSLTFVTTDVIRRLTALQQIYLRDGELPNIAGKLAEEAKESATVH